MKHRTKNVYDQWYSESYISYVYPNINIDKFKDKDIGRLMVQLAQYPRICEEFKEKIDSIIDKHFNNKEENIFAYRFLSSYLDFEYHDITKWYISIGGQSTYDEDIYKGTIAIDPETENFIEKFMVDVDAGINDFIHDYIYNNTWIDHYEYEIREDPYSFEVMVFHDFIIGLLGYKDNIIERVDIKDWTEKPNYKDLEMLALKECLTKKLDNNENG